MPKKTFTPAVIDFAIVSNKDDDELSYVSLRSASS